MNKITIIGNWKMNLRNSSSNNLINQIQTKLNNNDYHHANIIVCPSFIHLLPVKSELNIKIKLGCQDLFWENDGAYTGEISAPMVKDAGCKYAIIGHSERRMNLNESDNMINKKIIACFNNQITPIVCIGETIKQRKYNQTLKVLKNQILSAFKNISPNKFKNIYLAYEPIWAIGSNRPASPRDAKKAAIYIKNTVLKKYKALKNDFIKVLYGGSVNAQNIRSFTEIEEIDGVLVGGESISSSGFVKLINNSYK